MGRRRHRVAVHPLIDARLRSEHWADAIDGGTTAARALLGERIEHDAVPYFFTDQFDIGMGYAGVFMPGRPVTLECSERFSQLSLMIPRDQLMLELGQLLGQNPTSSLDFRSELSLADAGGKSIMQAVRMIDTAAAQPGGALSHPLAAQRLEETLIQSLLFGQPHNYTEMLTTPSRAAGRTPVSRAAKLLRSDPAKPWTVGELAANVSMSARGLQEGFRRSLDTTPMAYLRRLRLEKAHDELAAAEPGTVTVTEVATRWGFLHLGRFAAAYARAFREHPSATLRR